MPLPFRWQGAFCYAAYLNDITQYATNLTLGSLFDGIGVFPLAATLNGIYPLWASEIEEAPVSITKLHFPKMLHLGDITKLDGGDIPAVHIITFGSPCQNLSMIGNRAGLAGEKSSLFYHAIRIIKEMRDATHGLFPVIAVWEKGALQKSVSVNKGTSFPEKGLAGASVCVKIKLQCKIKRKSSVI